MEKKDRKPLWQGWKKELFWIIFFLLLLFTANVYRNETMACKKMIKTECFQKCEFEGGVEALRQRYQEDFPGATLTCDFKTNSCLVNGAPIPEDI